MSRTRLNSSPVSSISFRKPTHFQRTLVVIILAVLATAAGAHAQGFWASLFRDGKKPASAGSRDAKSPLAKRPATRVPSRRTLLGERKSQGTYSWLNDELNWEPMSLNFLPVMPQAQTSLPARGVEEVGRVYIGEPVSAYIGHMAMLMVTGKHPTVSDGTMQDTVNWVNDPLHSCVVDGTGGLAVYAHPEAADRVSNLTGLTGMEIFHSNEIPSASPFRDQMWDTVLTTLYAQGRPLIWGFASDDTHFTSPGNFNLAWNTSLVPSVDLFALKNALRNGAFYTSNGPILNSISVSGTTITIDLGQSSDVLWVRAGQYNNGGTFTQSATTLGANKAVKIEQGVTTASLDIASLGVPVSGLHFVRAIVRTSSTSYALSQPFLISAAGVISNPYPTSGIWVKGQNHNHTDAWIDNNTTGITTYRSNYLGVGQPVSFETAYSYWEVPYQHLDSDGMPDLTSVSPRKVPFGFQTNITINGVNFQDGVTVQLGTHPLSNVVRQSSTVLTATVPADLAPDVYDVVVTNPDNYRGNLAMALTVQDGTANNNGWISYNAPNLPWDQTTTVYANGDEVWVGTLKGAARFKNGAWTSFIPSGGLNIFSRGIYDITADPSGGMWFSSVGMWFRNAAGSFPWQWQSVKSSTTERWGKMAFDSAGTLWVTSRWGEGIAKRSTSGTWTVTTSGLPNTDNQSITRDSQGNMWVGFSGGQGIWKWNGSTWTNVPVPGGTAGLAQATYASALVTAPNGDVWAAVHPMNVAYAPEKSGVVRYIGGNPATTVVYKAPLLPHPRVTDIIIASNGDVWFASRAGVSRLNTAGQWQTFTTKNSGLVSDIVMDMAEDQFGNIWFATANGVSSFSSFDFSLSNSGDVSAAQGASGQTNITATIISSPATAVSFSVSGLPANATSSFSQASCTPTCSTTLTINTSNSTPLGTYPITAVAAAGNTTRSTNFNLIVSQSNQAPVAVNDSYSTNEDTPLNVSAPGVLANDTDADNNSLTAIQVSGPAHGSLTLNANGSFTYTPNANYNGPDSFTYKANDGTVDSNVATVSLTVNAVNDAPVAVNDSYNTNEDTALNVPAPGVLGNDTDADGDSLTAIQVSGPAHGSLTLNANGSFTYTPAANYNGPDSFTYKANDGTVDSNVATVSLTVNAVNDAPVAVNDSHATNEDTPLNVPAPGVLGNDTDAEGDSLTAIQVSGPTHGSLTLNANGSFTYTPNANYNGADSFTYKANDGTVDSNVATVSLTIDAVNDAPVAVNDSHATNEDTPLNVSAPGVLGNDTDAEGDSLTAIQVSGPAHGSLTLNANGSFTYTPAANYNGPDSFTYKANDGTVDSNVATVSLTINAVNDAPVAVNDSYNTNEDTALTVPVVGVLTNDTDVDGNSLTVIEVSGPAHGSLTLNANGSFTYTPAANYNGPDSFTYKANDGTVDSNVATVSLTVNAVNDAPVAVNDSYNTNEDTALNVPAPGVLANDTDVDGNSLTAIEVSGPAHGTLTLNANGSFTYTPTAGYSGPDSFTYKANDGTVDSTAATVSISVSSVNHAPVAANDSYSTNEDTALNLSAPGVLVNDTDADGNSLNAILVSGPAHGSLTLNANGSLTYTPEANYNGPDSFTYKANDGTVDSNVATVSLTINPVSDAPVAANDSYNTNEDSALNILAPGVLANDIDVDGNLLAAIVVSGPAHGTLTLNANGSFTYTPAANYNGPDGFTYQASDGTLQSNVASVSITVVPVNDAPVLQNPGSQSNSEGDNVLRPVTASDPDGDVLTYSATGLPLGLSIDSSTGVISGTVSAGASVNSPYSVQLSVSDGNAVNGTTTVTFSWTIVNGILFRAGSFSQTNGAATSLTITKPAGLVVGNVMLASINVRGNPNIITPAGWTLLSSVPNGTTVKQAIYVKVANASEANNYTWTFSTGQVASGGIVAYGGVDPLNPIDVVGGQANASSSSITAPSVSTTVANSMLVSIFGTAINASITPPAGATERGESSVGMGKDKIAGEISDGTRGPTGATGTRVATGDKSAVNIGHLVALRPAGPPPTSPPPAPANLTAASGDSQISLSWSASSGATSYNVKRLNAGTGLFETIQSGVLVTNYNDTGLQNGTAYTYVVSAVNSIGESDNSNQATATPCFVPTSPTGLVATAGNAQVSLSWTASAGASSYNIKRSTTSGGPYNIIGTNTSPSFIDATVTNGTTYFYVVSAVSSCGSQSSNSAQVTATPQGPGVPTAPSNLTASAQSGSQIRLTWTDTSNNEDGFKIERCAGNNCTNFVQITNPPLAAGTITYTDSGLSTNTQYRYRVRAYNAIGDSPYSNIGQAKTNPK